MRGPDSRPTSGLPEALAGSSPGLVGHPNPEASGSVNRWFRPESVRHMSVTTATQRLTAAHHETQRHGSKKARETGKTQLTGHFCRWWQVLGSNQRRLSRRFYREPIRTHWNGYWPAISSFFAARKPRSVRVASVVSECPWSERCSFRVMSHEVQPGPATSGSRTATLPSRLSTP